MDQVYLELSERWPEFFDEAEQSHPADQLLRVGEVLDQLYAVEEYNPFEGEMDQAVTGAANEIMERFFDLPQTRKTFADRQEAKLDAAKANGKQQVQKVREEYKARLDKLRQQNRQRVADTIDKERAKRDQKIQALKDRYAARDAAGIFSGMTAEEYQELAKLAKSQKAGEETGTEKKQAVLQALMDRGMNRREAYAFYALAKAANPGETNWTDVEGACYAGLSDSGKTKYQAVREYFVELPVSDFAYIQDILSGVEGDRDQSGKTVSGSLKRNKLAVLMGLGMTAAEAQVYYNLTK